MPARKSLERLEGDLLSLDLRDAVDVLELRKELLLERVVVGASPLSVLVERLDDRHLEVEAAAADLPRHRGLGQCFDAGQELGKQLLARGERL